MTKLSEAQDRLDRAQATAQDDATKNLVEAVQLILTELRKSEQGPDARTSSKTVRRTTNVHEKP